MGEVSKFVNDFLAKVEREMSTAGVAADRVKRIAIQAGTSSLAHQVITCAFGIRCEAFADKVRLFVIESGTT